MCLDALACQPELPEDYDDILCVYLFNLQTGQYRISRSRAATCREVLKGPAALEGS